MKALGIWSEAFRPTVKDLADMERELQWLKKSWREQGCPVEDKKDPMYPAICSLRRDILAHRNALGLTPAALKRLKPIPEEPEKPAGKLTPLEIVRGKKEKQA